jgi:YHS domain-containing protein
MRVAAAVLLCLFSGASVMAWASDEPRVAIQGYDPVAYFTESRPVKGSAAIYEDFDGRRYHFANPRHKAMFIADPDRYVPQFGANCAVAVSRGRSRAASPLYWAIVEDRLYLFAAAEAAEFIAKNPGWLAKARRHWASMSK